MAEIDIPELGYGQYPPKGEEEGYSFVIIFRGGDKEMEQARDIYGPLLFGRT